MRGIELNPRAAEVAEMVLWIGYLQWHFRTRGNVIDVLAEVAAAESRADGWTLLTRAQNRLHQRLPLEVRLLKERLGRNWPHDAMALLPESFETRTKPLPNGSAGATRIVNRVMGEAWEVNPLGVRERAGRCGQSPLRRQIR